jgi:hypothetical protein
MKLSPIRPLKNAKKGFDRPVDRSVELHFGLCLQQSVYGGVGVWLKDIGRGPQTFNRSAAEPQPKKHLPRRHGDTENFGKVIQVLHSR